MFHGGLPEVKEGYTVNEVPITLRSDSIFTPNAPLRPTQTNIGHFLAKRTNAAEESYGVHKSEYSGTGETEIPSGKYEQIVPRKISHIRTGIHGNPELPISKRCMANRIKQNEGLFAMNINKVGEEVFAVSRNAISKPLPKLAQKQLFPRSIVFEVEYAKALSHKAMLEALERERALFEQKLLEKKAHVQMNVSGKTSHGEEKSFKSDNSPNHQAEQESNVQADSLSQERHTSHHHAKCTSICGTCGCTLKRGLCPTCFKAETKFYDVHKKSVKGWKDEACISWPNKEPKYISPWGKERKAELLRVGYPFATEAAFWLNCTVPPFDTTQFYRPSKKRFPERSFSSLNI